MTQVLIVDDSLAVRTLLGRQIHRWGYWPIEAADAAEAVQWVQLGAIDLVVTDLEMPGLNGIGLIRELKVLTPDVPVIVLTGKPTLERAVEAMRDGGAFDFLDKRSSDPELLRRSITKALERRWAALEGRQHLLDLERASIRDRLTGLFNRSQLEIVLPQEVQRARRYDRPLTLVELDVDGMSGFNDRHGADAGDALLRAIATSLSRATRHSDWCFRSAEDGFVVLLTETDKTSGLADCRRLVQRCMATVVYGPEGEPIGGATISAGVVACPADGQAESVLLAALGAALGRAKQQGPGQVWAAGMATIHPGPVGGSPHN